MGLNEKRAAEEIKTKWNSEWKGRVLSALPKPVEIEVKFETIVKDGQSGYAVDAFEKVFVESSAQSFKELCKDSIGKEAVGGALKRIVIQNVEGTTNGDLWATFSGGTLTLDHGLANVDYVQDRVNGLVKMLSDAL